MTASVGGFGMRARAVLPVLLLLAELAHPHPGEAQRRSGFDSIGVGTRVRVSGRGPERRVGVLVRVGADSVLLRSGMYGSHSIPLADIRGVDVFAGARRHPWRGAAIGLGAGLAALATRELFASTCVVSVDGVCVHARHPYLLPNTDDGVIVGGAIVAGALLGALTRTDQWRPLPWPGPISGRLEITAPGSSRIGIALSLTRR